MSTETVSEVRPLFSLGEDSRWADLPAHQYTVDTHQCVFCGQEPLWDSYEDYVENYYEDSDGASFNDDGSVSYPEPDPREEFEFLALTCLSTDHLE